LFKWGKERYFSLLNWDFKIEVVTVAVKAVQQACGEA
jgi:hypothetical protein